MTKHTPGPLHATKSGKIRDRSGRVVAGCGLRLSTGLLTTLDDIINAEHIAACWNACEGINPEAVPELLEALDDWAELMVAAPENTEQHYEQARQARAVLAKARGEE